MPQLRKLRSVDPTLIDNSAYPAHGASVRIRTKNVLLIREGLTKALAARSTEDMMSEVARIAKIHSALMGVSAPAFPGSPLKCPQTGLLLPPPPPDILWEKRKEYPELRRTTFDQFIELTSWSRYRNNGLLTSLFVKTGDISLYDAIVSRAKYVKQPVSVIFSELRIHSRHALDNPDRDLAGRAPLLRAAEAYLYRNRALEPYLCRDE